MIHPHPALSPQRFTSLHDWAMETIGRDIAAGRLAPGRLLRTEELMDTHHLGRGTAREVILALAGKGMLHSRHGIGIRVREPEQWNLLDADVLRWRRAAGLDEEIDRDIRELAKRALELGTVLEGNALYQQLMRNLGADDQQEPA